MNIRKLINSCAFDLPVCFPVPITGLELLQISFPFIFLYPVILYPPYPFIIAASSILLSGECYSFLSAKFHLRHLYHAKVTILFVAEIFLFTMEKRISEQNLAGKCLQCFGQ